MAHDGSLVALVEDWMVSAIGTANDAIGNSAHRLKMVDHYEGAVAEVAKGAVNELFQRSERFALVAVDDGTVRDLSPPDQYVGTRYIVLVGVAIRRKGGSPRIGDGTTPGVHYYRAMIRQALHDKHPGAEVEDQWCGVEACRFVAPWRTLWHEATRVVIAMVFEVGEVPKAT